METSAGKPPKTSRCCSHIFLWLILIALIRCLLSPTRLAGRELERDFVCRAIETWVRSVTADARPNAIIKRLEAHTANGRMVGYIAHLAGGGFCICGADDGALPVYLYAPNDAYDGNNPDLQFILWEVGKRQEVLNERLAGEGLSQSVLAGLSEKSQVWQDLAEGLVPSQYSPQNAPPSYVPSIMALDFTPAWHQGRAGPSTSSWFNTFNEFCPVLTPSTYDYPVHPTVDEHCKVGCPATAMSQVMYYWKWPKRGEGVATTYYDYRWRPSGSYGAARVAVDPRLCVLDSNDWPWWGRLGWENNYLIMKGYWDESLYEEAQTLYEDWSESNRDLYRNALEGLWNNTPNVTSEPCTVDLGATTYQWDLMDDVWETALPDSSKDAMRTICYHSGVAAEQEYGIEATGTVLENDCSALIDHFRYSADAAVVGPPDDVGLIREDIQWLRPVIFRGTNPESGGHHWVIYGYNLSTNQYKMNMGWGEDYNDVWYALDDPNLGYAVDHQQIARLAPRGPVLFVGNTKGGDGSPESPFLGIEEALAAAPDNTTLIFKAGSVNTFSVNTLVINRPLTLKGYDVTICKQ